MSFIPHMDLEFVDPYKQQNTQSFKPKTLFEMKKSLLYGKLLSLCDHKNKVYGFSNKQVGELLNLKERQAHKYMKELEKEGKIFIKVHKYCMSATKRWVNERFITINDKIDHPESKKMIEDMKFAAIYHQKKKEESRARIAKALAKKRKDYQYIPKIMPGPYTYDFSQEAYRAMDITPKIVRPRMATSPPHIRAILDDMTDDYLVDNELEKVENFVKLFKM